MVCCREVEVNREFTPGVTERSRLDYSYLMLVVGVAGVSCTEGVRRVRRRGSSLPTATELSSQSNWDDLQIWWRGLSAAFLRCAGGLRNRRRDAGATKSGHSATYSARRTRK